MPRHIGVPRGSMFRAVVGVTPVLVVGGVAYEEVLVCGHRGRVILSRRERAAKRLCRECVAGVAPDESRAMTALVEDLDLNGDTQ